MQPQSDRRSSAAFTLVEVLLALMLFSLSAVVLGAAYLNVLNGYEMVRQNEGREEDLRMVRSMILQQPDREELERGGEVEGFYLGRIFWRAHIDPAPTPDLFLVTVEIEYRPHNSDLAQQDAQQFYLFRPSWSDPAENNNLREQMQQRLEAYQNYRQW
ncbi:MAG TPA: prepilin-type N-terminal cleavage/methylation domain-containing protein [Opitutales bacterium]|nr:prepilin-type N-terminal cleavage/methylation domain-containing protein [Opitutales bacterium]